MNKAKIAFVVFVLAMAVIIGQLVAAHATERSARVSYRYTTKAKGMPTIVIEGKPGALKAEDSIKLRVIDYDPGLIVYRVVTP